MNFTRYNKHEHVSCNELYYYTRLQLRQWTLLDLNLKLIVSLGNELYYTRLEHASLGN
jgi:hypothetical protein